VLRIDARADDLGEVPVVNTIAELRGREKPNEYVLLSAHFDSWDGGSGATDNGTGTLIMMEAMRLLNTAYPNPKRTILVGHWGGEERGHNGSRAFADDHPDIVRGIHAGFNHDYGTGRIVRIALEGFADAGPSVARWISRLPLELTDSLTLENPGLPGPGGSDYATFDCRGVPVFNLISTDWNYDTYTWHTDRDTFDKISFDDLRRSATLVAMLAYRAAEDAEQMSREQRTVFPVDPDTGERTAWPTCEPPRRSWAEYLRSR
jgi:Zn-dependent M28 family amino/carboxypeptidase